MEWPECRVYSEFKVIFVFSETIDKEQQGEDCQGLKMCQGLQMSCLLPFWAHTFVQCLHRHKRVNFLAESMVISVETRVC